MRPRRCTKVPHSCRHLPPGVVIGVDRLASRILCRPDDRLPLVALPLLEVAALDIVKLHLQDPCLLPFAIRAIFDIADDRLERALAQVFGELVLVEAFSGVDPGTFALGVLCVLCGLLLLSRLSLPRPRSLVLTMFMPLYPALLGY